MPYPPPEMPHLPLALALAAKGSKPTATMSRIWGGSIRAVLSLSLRQAPSCLPRTPQPYPWRYAINLSPPARQITHHTLPLHVRTGRTHASQSTHGRRAACISPGAQGASGGGRFKWHATWRASHRERGSGRLGAAQPRPQLRAGGEVPTAAPARTRLGGGVWGLVLEVWDLGSGSGWFRNIKQGIGHYSGGRGESLFGRDGLHTNRELGGDGEGGLRAIALVRKVEVHPVPLAPFEELPRGQHLEVMVSHLETLVFFQVYGL